MSVKINLKTKICFNGQEYGSLEEMPPDVRQLYGHALASGQIRIQKSTRLVFNGQEYNSLDEMPEPVRRQYEQVMALVDTNQDGIPDMLEPGQSSLSLPVTANNNSSTVSTSANATGLSPRDLRWILAGIGILILVVILTSFVVIWFMSQAAG